MTDSVCPACGYTAPETDGPTHVYLSPAAHHSIADERRARQSINIHLASPKLQLEDSASTVRALIESVKS